MHPYLYPVFVVMAVVLVFSIGFITGVNFMEAANWRAEQKAKLAEQKAAEAFIKRSTGEQLAEWLSNNKSVPRITVPDADVNEDDIEVTFYVVDSHIAFVERMLIDADICFESSCDSEGDHRITTSKRAIDLVIANELEFAVTLIQL